MTAFFVFDIETVADGRLIQRVRYPEQRDLSPGAAIQHYRQQLLDEKGTDFIPHTFQVPVSIAIVLCDQQLRIERIVTLDRPQFRPQVITRQFWEGWNHYRRPTFVTLNGRGFDLPVMELSAFRYGIPLPSWFAPPGAKAWEDPRNRYHSTSHIDVQDVLTNHGAARLNGGLNLCATLLGKPGKMDTKGDMVQDLWDAGEQQRIDDYCVCDSLDTYFVFLRTRVLQGLLSLDEERELVDHAHGVIEGLQETYPSLTDYLAHFHFWQPYADDDNPFVR